MYSEKLKRRKGLHHAMKVYNNRHFQITFILLFFSFITFYPFYVSKKTGAAGALSKKKSKKSKKSEDNHKSKIIKKLSLGRVPALSEINKIVFSSSKNAHVLLLCVHMLLH